jgi:hypothetical protein
VFVHAVFAIDSMPHEVLFLQTKETGIIHPLNDHKVTWDLVICVLVIYSVVVIPLRIGFGRKASTGFVVFDTMIDCAFFIDMCLTFNTAYLDQRLERYVYDRRAIATHYLKFWFWVDFVSTVPIDDIVSLLSASSHKASLQAIRAVRILRLGRLAKLQRINVLSEYLEEKLGIGPSQMNLVMLMLQIFFVAHVFACFWHFLALPSNVPGTQSWLTVGGFDTGTPESQYIAALYYAIVTMLTVGYGDIHPTNEQERAFSVFMMLSGGVIFGALLSKVASVIEKRHPQARAFKENMDEVCCCCCCLWRDRLVELTLLVTTQRTRCPVICWSHSDVRPLLAVGARFLRRIPRSTGREDQSQGSVLVLPHKEVLLRGIWYLR